MTKLRKLAGDCANCRQGFHCGRCLCCLPEAKVALLVQEAQGSAALTQSSVVASFWEGKSPRTVKAYREDLERMATWAGQSSIERFAVVFFAAGPGSAYRTANSFKAWGMGKGWSPSYVNNHLAALRSLVKFARRIEHIEWSLDIEGVRVESYTDTRGPGFDGMVKLANAAEAQEDTWASARDQAIVLLFATMGLRRDEIVSLDLKHVDLVQKRIFAQRKKKTQRVYVTIPDETAAAIEVWLQLRGAEPGPLFTSRAVGRRRKDGRLAESSVWAIIKDLGTKAGIKVRPHGLRHAAITEVLDFTKGDIRSAQKFAGHANPMVTTKYDDNRQDVAGEMAGKLSKSIAAAREKAKGK